MPNTDIKTPERVSRTTIRLAGELAHHAAEYERAWRASDDAGMKSHLGQLDTLCDGDPSATLIRAACVIAAASTRGSVTTDRSKVTAQHLASASQRDELITDYLLGLDGITGAELFGTV